MEQDPAPISRHDLTRILALDPDASDSQILRAGLRLLTKLERRRHEATPEECAALQHEMATLTRSMLRFTPSDDPSRPRDREGPSLGPRDSHSRGRWRIRNLLGAALAVGLLALLISGYAWVHDMPTERPGPSDSPIEPARLVVESRPKNAELRIRSPESEELLLKIEGQGARIELAAGAYEIEVSREDCPDSWIRAIELEPGETRRYEPTICAGAGELVVRSNLTADRLRIDEFDVGSTRAEPHLLGVGDHDLRVDKEGYLPFEGKVRIRPDERKELRVELVRDPGGAQEAPVVLPPLPFEKISPSLPPELSNRPARSDAGDGRPAFVPDPILPDPIRADRAALPTRLFELDSPGEKRGLPRGGSTPWLDAMANRIRTRFDADRSGRIDRDSETEAIPCAVWLEIEESFDEAGLGLSMSRFYGFDGSEWHPDALGFAVEQRALAYQRMRGCGLAP